MSPRPAAVMFDLGGVLLDVDVPRMKAGVASVFRRPVEVVDGAVFGSGMKAGFDLGRWDADTFHALVSAALGAESNSGRFAAAWCDVFTERRATTALLPALAERVPLYVGSNTDPLHAGFIRDGFSWADAFTHAWLSFEAGVAKPDLRFWVGALDAFGLEAASVVYLDDRLDNVASAAALGLHVIHVTDDESAREGLVEAGLLDP